MFSDRHWGSVRSLGTNTVIIDVRGLLWLRLRFPHALDLLLGHNWSKDIITSHKINWIFSDTFGMVSTAYIFPKQGRSLCFGENLFFSLCPAVFFCIFLIQRSYPAGHLSITIWKPGRHETRHREDRRALTPMWAGGEQTAYRAALFRQIVRVPTCVAEGPVLCSAVLTSRNSALSHLAPKLGLSLPLATSLSQCRHPVSCFSSLAIVPIYFFSPISVLP